VLIENCANLKSIEIYLKSPRSDSAEPKWLICKDLPKLESFVAAGSLLSLQIEAAPSLKTVKVGECQKLGILSLIGSSVLKELDINGCKKLQWVQGLTEEQEAQLYVESKVDANCTNPVDPSFPFKDLNFRQVNEVLEVINKGMLTDFERGRPNQYDDDLSIQQYSIELLRPLEQTNTGGTGEQYAYQLVTENGCGPDQLVGSTSGEHSPEDCLNSALQSATDFIIIDGVDDQSETVVFDYLKKYGKENVIAPEIHNEVTSSSNGVHESFQPTGSVYSDAPVIRTLCISGKLPSGLRKADYETALANVKIKLLDDVSQGLTYLVLADPASTSAKAEKARKLGVQVISEDQLIALTSGKWNGL
jgi:NAD-dependent DNA ligase